MRRKVFPRTPHPPAVDMTGWGLRTARLKRAQYDAAKAARIAEAREAARRRKRKGRAVRLGL